jgi:hypothetical protein
VPGDKCWPSPQEWKAFDDSLGSGRLIKTQPIAESCYDRPDKKNLNECAYVAKMWPDQDFQTENPIGRPLPYNITCAPVDYAAGSVPTTCIQGQSPPYAVNVTSRSHIVKALKFAQSRNLRITVVSTGHDMLGRSDGYGSLELWLRYYRKSIDFQKTFTSATGCSAAASRWSGSAIHINGAWQWRDVHPVAQKNNVIVVSGGSVSPGATGGWPSGGGHGPATRNYGLGADQILEAEVMLANGSIVVANHCQNTDLFRALRGGGPGYGVVLGTTIKAHPNINVATAHRLVIAPYHQTPNNSDLLDAVTVMLQAFPELNTAGYGGYAYWYRNLRTVLVNNATSGYSHSIWAIDKSRDEAVAAFAPVRKALSKFEDRLFINETYITYPDYWSLYYGESGQYDPAGISWVITSRMIDPPVLRDYNTVRETVEVISGEPDQYVGNVVLLVSGGQVFVDANDRTSGLNPAWRTSPFVLATWRNPANNATNAERKVMNDDITFVKGAALKKLAPTTGGYMNEGDRNDPDYIQTFYGANYQSHLAAKKKYDPGSAFYCPTCVGAEAFVDSPNGPLCRA